ncbi:M16 family metallopeptidase [Halomonas organivorans]|uniref:Peptidase M16 N-terminal domain-containing protein n=1 Tax=Halomonas organivorans TaxID=257772 RepID=A0A7W5BZ81_9GAMM|nr:insulinase family protein [Halomonas organivorans]MBB3141780.1 hypothetical protein [Halomonas organivorans]
MMAGYRKFWSCFHWLPGVAAGIVFFMIVWLLVDSVGGQEHDVYVQRTDAREVQVHVIVGHGHPAPGLAHYVEHLAWLNTVGGKQRSADRHSNAWTNRYAAGYWLSGKPDDLEDILQNLSGLFHPLGIPAEFAEEERDIILREYEHQTVNKPDAQAAEAMNAFLYAGNSIASSVIGTPGDIRALDYDEARALHEATHQPDNATLVVVGDVSERQVSRALQKVDWPGLEKENTDIVPPTFELAPPAKAMLRYPQADASPRLTFRRVVELPEPVQFDLLEAHATLLRDILDTNLPGGLAGPLRFDASIARRFDIQIWPIDERHVELSFTAAPDREASLSYVRVAFEEKLAEIAASGIPEETYHRVFSRFEHFWPDWDDSDESARWMAGYVLDRVSALRKPLQVSDVKRLQHNLSYQTINTLLNEIAGEGRTAAAFIGPEERF